MPWKNDTPKSHGIRVYLETHKTRKFVGNLFYEGKEYIFKYHEAYITASKSIPLGEDLPLTKKTHISSTLFSSFLDRIPSRGNPAYQSYCKQFGIKEDETDVFVLLATIGRKGPSSFIFEPIFEPSFGSKELKAWRNYLGLTTREFANAFGISQATLVRIENEQTSGATVMPLLETFYKYPNAAADYAKKHGKGLHGEKQKKLPNILWSDVLTSAEIKYSILAREQLRKSQYKGVLKLLRYEKIEKAFDQIDQQGLTLEETLNIKSFFFETRFARDIDLANLEFDYECKIETSKKSKSIDFFIKPQPPKLNRWLIELTTFKTSQAVKENTAITDYSGGSQMFEYSSGESSENKGNSPEVRDIIKAQRAILKKAAKFTKVLPDTYNIILMDIRGFNSSVNDEGDYLNIIYGSHIFLKGIPNFERNSYARNWINPKTKEKSLVKGIFDLTYEENCSDELKEEFNCLKRNVHGIGFISEKNYKPGEIVGKIKLYGNPNIFGEESIKESSSKIRKGWKKVFPNHGDGN